MSKPSKASVWIDRIARMEDTFMSLETTDGTRREGKITGLGMRKIEINGEDVDWPIEFEVNGDPGDRIPIDRVLRINFQ